MISNSLFDMYTISATITLYRVMLSNRWKSAGRDGFLLPIFIHISQRYVLDMKHMVADYNIVPEGMAAAKIHLSTR